MGFNTTVVVLNDCLTDIEKDKDFGKKLVNAISHASLGEHADRYRLDVSAGPSYNAATVIESHHADNTTLVSIGGNCGTKLIETYGWCHNENETQIRLLEQLAASLGYKVVKEAE